MTDPTRQQQERDELDLDAETVKDLEPDQQTADHVRGGKVGGIRGGGPGPLPGPGPVGSGGC